MTFQSRTLPSPRWRNTAPFLYHGLMELSLDIIYDSEPEQAAAHVLAYFRQEFAKPFPPPKPLSREEKALIEQIDAAFDGVTLEDGIGLMTTQLLDMYAPKEVCAAVAPSEERSDWRRITPAMARTCWDALNFTDPRGYRFLLPAWLTLDLRGQLGDFDAYEEERLGGKSFGSTKSGIAPFYSDKYAKIGFQVSELFDDELLKEKVVRVAEQKNVLLEHLYHKPLIDPDELYKELVSYRDMVAPYVCDVSLFLHNALKEGKNILLEGQLGSLKDPDHGIYPMVTSSSTLAAYGAIGAGIPPYEIKQVITVCKAYSSAVGAGAFVSEIFGEEADELRRRGGDGGEYGATTGRPRRVGWFDCVASKYGCRMQGTTDVAFTVLDVLGYLDEIPVCVGYEIDGEVTTDFPVTHLLEKAKPVLKTLPGWKEDIRGIRKYEDLPENCRNYIEFIEKEVGYPFTMISNGPGRDDIIYRNR